MKKTAMQEMIEQIDSIKEFDRKSTIFNLKEIAKHLLEKETQQIIDAYNEDLYGGLSGHSKFNDGEQYYNDTYGEGK